MRFSSILVPWLVVSGCSFEGAFRLPSLTGDDDEVGDAAVSGTRPRWLDANPTVPSNSTTPTLPTHTADAGEPAPTGEQNSREEKSNSTPVQPTSTAAPNDSTDAPEPWASIDAGTPIEPTDPTSEDEASNGDDTTVTTGGTSAPTAASTSQPGDGPNTSQAPPDTTHDQPNEDPTLDAGAPQSDDDTTDPPNGTISTNMDPSTAPSTNTGAPTSSPTTQPSTPTTDTEACNTLLVEGFENIALLGQTGWFTQNNSSPLGTTGWLQGDANIFPAQEGSGGSAITASYTNASSVGTISNWLVTPEVPLYNGAVFAFWTRDFGSQFADRLQLRLSTSGDSENVGASPLDVGDFTGLLLDINATYSADGYPNDYTAYQVTIDGLEAPTTGRLAFRYFVENGGPMGSRSDYVAIDSVVYPACADAQQPGETTDNGSGDGSNDTGSQGTDSQNNGTDTSGQSEDAGTNDSAYQLVVHEGAAQTGLVGFAPNVAPTVRVLDELGQGVGGAPVTFVVTAGGGSVSGGEQVTDPHGYARPGKWTLGPTPGVNALHATLDGASSASVTFNATGIQSGFDVELQYVTGISPEHEAVFEAAKQRWEELIIGDLPSVNQWLPSNTCGTHPELSGSVDDLKILVSVGTIDGVHGVLGQAGPCVVRGASGGLPVAGANGLPVIGMMRFDVEDLNALAEDDQLESVILHEMGHVLGLNSIHWLGNGYLQNPMPNSGSNDTHFSGTKAREAFLLVGGSDYSNGSTVPVENCVGIPGCGAGTYNSHWREFALDNELMTGFVSPPGVSNPLSRVTVASLWDIGYVVNLDGADAYYNTFSNLLGLETAPQSKRLEELPYDGPIYVATDEGLTTLPTP